MKLFVTGGTGFLGSHFLAAACAAGHEVVALRRPGSAVRAGLAPSASLRWVEGALDDFDFSALDGAHTLVHLAAAGVSPKPVSWPDAFRFNVEAPLILTEEAAKRGVSRFIIGGSIAEYGRAADRYDAIPPDAPLEPSGAYATSKAAASMAFLGLARDKSLSLAVLRASNLYGEGQHPSNFWMQLRSAALESRDLPLTLGEQQRDFLPVEQAAREFVRACAELRLEPGRPRVLHVASGRPTTLGAFAQSEWARLGAKGRLLLGALPYRPHEAMRAVPAETPW